ncbi:MAG: tetratricopeptide repeat protein [Myxococcota bacterium]|nr:tetratricopeptide repeat protein [Myxococcota bacterium]
MSQKIPTQAKLLLAIFVVIAASIGFYKWSEFRRIEAMKEREQSPKARVDRALERAQRATINKQFRHAEDEYKTAYEAIDEAILERPDSIKLKRSKLVILKQLSHWTKHRKDFKAAYRWSDEAVKLATMLLESQPTDTRARRDRISTAVAYAEAGALAEPDARAILQGAIEAVSKTTETVPPSASVREMLARGWAQVAKAAGLEDDFDASYAASRKGLTWSRSGTTADEQNRRLNSLPYQIAEAASQLAREKNDTERQIEFEKETLVALAVSARLDDKSATIQGMLAARRARLADLFQKKGNVDEAERLHQLAVKTLAATVTQYPKRQKLRLSWVRALNHQGAFYSETKKNKRALAAYESAYQAAESLTEKGRRAKLISMGNYAQLLGRLDRIIDARKIAEKAYLFANSLSDESAKTWSLRLDVASSGLRLARLLRATPRPDKKRALEVATNEYDVLTERGELKTKKARKLKTALRSLIQELRRR